MIHTGRLALVKAALLIVGVLIFAAIVWDASERHYDSCINAAKATTKPIFSNEADEILRRVDPGPGGTRESRIAGCSRIPF